jgi:hypothetical protein
MSAPDSIDAKPVCVVGPLGVPDLVTIYHGVVEALDVWKAIFRPRWDSMVLGDWTPLWPVEVLESVLVCLESSSGEVEWRQLKRSRKRCQLARSALHLLQCKRLTYRQRLP